jgi:phospho-N-acetylmuramoyl-pentapeptide-transferase
MRTGIFIPFLLLFLLFIVDLLSSFLQIFWKKYFKKKLFLVAPLHHLLEKKGINETTIVMKARFIQGILAAITVIILFYQVSKTIIN